MVRSLADGFKTLQLAWMHAGRKGLHEGKYRRAKRENQIPESLMDQRWLGVPLIADLQNRPYERVLPEVKAGLWGTPIKVGRRSTIQSVPVSSGSSV